MGLIQWSKDKIHKLSIWDFAVTKIVLVIFGMILGAYVAAFVKEYVLYFIAAFVIGYIYLLCKVFKK